MPKKRNHEKKKIFQIYPKMFIQTRTGITSTRYIFAARTQSINIHDLHFELQYQTLYLQKNNSFLALDEVKK